MSRSGICASICSRSADEPARMSIGSLSCSYSVRRLAPRELRRRLPAELAAAARRPRRPAGTRGGRSRGSGSRRTACFACFWNVGSKTAGRKDTLAARARSCRPRTRPRRSRARRPARTASSCRVLPRGSCPRTAPCPGRRSPCRASACSATASPTAARSRRSTCSRRQPSIGTTSRSAPMPNALVEEPRELADRHAVPHRDRIQADERLEARLEHRALDRDAADRVRPVADDRPARRGVAAARRQFAIV